MGWDLLVVVGCVVVLGVAVIGEAQRRRSRQIGGDGGTGSDTDQGGDCSDGGGGDGGGD